MKISKFTSILTLIIAFSLPLAFTGCGKKEEAPKQPSAEEIKKMEQEFSEFAKSLEDQLAKHYTEVALAYWTAANSGSDADFAKMAELEKNYNAFLSDKTKYEELKKFYNSELIQDHDAKRRLLLLYNAFTGYQIDTAKLNAMTELSTQIGKKFQNFRAKVGKKEITDNEVENILKSSKDSKQLQATWLAHKEIGPLVAEDLIKLIKMRNEVAKELGFANYHEMSLKLSDQNPEDVQSLFDELDQLTSEPFKQLKTEMDGILATQLKIKPEELMPWHYQNRFFQEAPAIYEIDLDTYYKGKDVVAITDKFYKSIGLETEDITKRSDLFERKGKNQHAFCTDIDRDKQDVRVLCNITPSQKWMGTQLHEYGHAVYFKYHDAALPWTLKTPAHIFTTEAIAMLFERFASNPTWMQEMLGLPLEEVSKIADICKKSLRLEQLVFSRWSQVMYRFEKGLYENPDQDLNKLWWDLVERYQMIKRPADRNMPDWATKIHIATSPCYYHNYHLGALFASQLQDYVNHKLLKLPEGEQSNWIGKTEIGKYFDEKVFKPGAKYYWNDMIEQATGEKLSAKYYAKQFVN